MSTIKIKILTLNTWKGDGDYFTRLHVMANQLKYIAPDVIACQECFSIPDTNVNTIEFLAKHLDMYGEVTPARNKKRTFQGNDVTSISGLGILSRLPLRLLDEIALPYAEADGERKIQIAEIDVHSNKKIAVVNVHLTHLQHASELREQQLKTIINAITALPHECVLICGDFNAEADAPEMKLLQPMLNARNGVLIGTEQIWNETRDNFQIQKSVDHIFLTRNAMDCRAWLSDTAMTLNGPDDQTGCYASDHPALLTTLNITV